jgi:hypothetical protein
MTRNVKSSAPRGSVRMHMIVAAGAAMVFLGLLGMMLLAAPWLVRYEMVGQLWFVLLVVLGLCAAVLVFALFRSWASYKGKVLNGDLEIGGPAVAMLLIVVLGFFLPKPATSFQMTVFLYGESIAPKMLAQERALRVDLGSEPRIVDVGSSGEAHFFGIPHEMRGQAAVLTYDSAIYELAEPNGAVTLDDSPKRVRVQAKELPFRGTIFDDAMKPIVGARVSIGTGNTETDGDGSFELLLAADLTEVDRTLTVTADGYEIARATAYPGAHPLELKLKKIP